MPGLQEQDLEVHPTQYLEILMRRIWVLLGTAFAVFMACALYAFMSRPVFEANALVEIEKPSVGVNGGVIIEQNEDDAYFQTQYALFKTDTLTQQVYDELGLDKTQEFRNPHGLQRLQKAITITPYPRTRLAWVQVDSFDPTLASKIANRLGDDFVKQNLQNQLFMSKDVLEALQLDKKGMDARRMAEALPSVVDNKLIMTLKDQRIALEAQIADMSQRLTANHPTLVAAKSRLASLDKLIQQEINNVILSLKSTLSGQMMGNNVRVVDPAKIPETPTYPKKILWLVLGLLGGLGVGTFAAMVVELIDQSVRTQEDVERKLDQAFLGLVPYAPQKSTEKVYASLIGKEASLTSEAFRNLRTMVDFARVGDGAGPLMVTSSVQEEGKSYVSANLAAVFAHLGEKVLLIDGDLRRPKMHKSFGLSTERGLSDFLAGGAKLDDARELVQDTEIENLYVMTCGPKPPNPAELLNTPRVGALLAWAQKHYQRVIIDCTPAFPISDTLLWGRHARSSVFVVRSGRTRAPLVRNACSRLSAAGIKLLGVVVNAAQKGGLSYSSYYQDPYQSHYYLQDGEKREISKTRKT